MGEFYIKHKQHNGTLIAELKPLNLAFTLNDGTPHTISYDVAWSNPVVSHDFVGPYRTDFELWYDSTRIMAGMHTSHFTNTKDEAAKIGGKDWLHYLEKRHYPFDPRTSPKKWYDFAINSPHKEGFAYEAVNTDITEILENIFDVVFGRPNSMAITYPTLATGIGVSIPTFSLPIGDTTNMLAIVKQYSDNKPGYHFEVLDTKEFRLYSPHKYNPLVADDITLANHTYKDAASGLVDAEWGNLGPEGTHMLGISSDPRLGIALGTPAGNEVVYRRLDANREYQEVANSDLVESLTRGDFTIALQPQHELTLTVKPDVIGNSFWTLQRPGEAIWADIELKSHRVNSAQEIVSVAVTVTNEGEVEATLGCNQIYADDDVGVFEG